MIKKIFQKYKMNKLLKKRFPNVIFGSNMIIESFDQIDNLNIKDYAYIGANAIWSLRGKISIGNNVIFGPRCILWPYNHNYNSSNFIPYGPRNEDIIKEIVIEDNVSIGMNTTILAGVKIEEGAIIASNSVVTKDVAKYAIVGGNPSRFIKNRNIEEYELLKKEGKLYLPYKVNNYNEN